MRERPLAHDLARRVEVFDTAGLLDEPWQALVSCIARVSRLTYIKNTRTGLWATREEVGYYPYQVRHGAKLLGGAIRAHWALKTVPITSGMSPWARTRAASVPGPA